MATPDASKALEILETLTANPPKDKNLKSQLYNAVHELASAVETQLDSAHRIIYSPSTFIFAYIESEMKIFSTLMKQKSSCTAAKLASSVGADATLTGRIARYLASHGIINEVGFCSYEANNISETLAIEDFRAGTNHNFQTVLPCLQATLEFLKKINYANPDNALNNPFQLVFNIDLYAFVWIESRPGILQDFNLYMGAVHYDSGPETSIFVDIGGGLGYQCVLLKAVPGLIGRIILKDMPSAIEQASYMPGIENMALVFWGEQPVKGARVYYMRHVLHDYPDEKCQIFLKNTIAAMGPDSVLFIDEIIIPDKGAHARSTEFDMVMMACFAVVERTQNQSETLLSSCGLRVLHSETYNAETGESLQIVKVA